MVCVVVPQELLNCAADCLLLVLVALEMLVDVQQVHVVKDGGRGCILNDLGSITESKEQGPKCLHSDCAKTKSTLSSKVGVHFLRYSFDEHKLTVSSKIFDAEYCTFPYLWRPVLQALVKEGQ